MPNCFGTKKDFAREIGIPIAKMRELDATLKEVADGTKASNLFTELTKTILLRRTNEVNAQSDTHIHTASPRHHQRLQQHQFSPARWPVLQVNAKFLPSKYDFLVSQHSCAKPCALDQNFARHLALGDSYY